MAPADQSDMLGDMSASFPEASLTANTARYVPAQRAAAPEPLFALAMAWLFPIGWPALSTPLAVMSQEL